MPVTSDVTIKVDADTTAFDAKIRRIRHDVRWIGLAAHLTLALTFVVAFVLGITVGLVA